MGCILKSFIIYTLQWIFIRMIRQSRLIAHMEKMRNAYTIIVTKYEGKSARNLGG
jgi:hypothetical protein